MNLELVRLIKYEMTGDFLDEFKKFLTSTAKDHELDSTSLEIIVAIADQLHEVPETELSGWFSDKDGMGWETVLNAMTVCISNYIRLRHSTDGEWILENPVI
jgi:hypothetical protein